MRSFIFLLLPGSSDQPHTSRTLGAGVGIVFATSVRFQLLLYLPHYSAAPFYSTSSDHDRRSRVYSRKMVPFWRVDLAIARSLPVL